MNPKPSQLIHTPRCTTGKGLVKPYQSVSWKKDHQGHMVQSRYETVTMTFDLLDWKLPHYKCHVERSCQNWFFWAFFLIKLVAYLLSNGKDVNLQPI